MRPILATMTDLEPRRLLAPLVSGTTVAGTLATGSQVDTYEITASAGQRVLVNVGETSTGAFAPTLSLVNASSQVVSTATGASGAFLDFVIPTTGTYTLRVNDANGANAGSYQVTGYVSGRTFTDSDTFTLESGRRRALTIAPGNLDVYSIDVTAGQFVSVMGADNINGPVLNVGLQVFDPSGNRIANVNGPGAVFDIPNAQTGTYTAVFYSFDNATTSIYGVGVAQIPGDQYAGDPDTAFLSPGTTRNGDLPSGDFDIFSFYANSNVTINATMTDDATDSNTLEPLLYLIGPDGNIIDQADGATTANVTGTATTAGLYYVVSRDREADDGGRFNFNYTLSSGDGVTPTTPGGSGLILNGTGGADNVVFSVTAGVLTVTTNGTPTTYTLGSASRIEYQAGAGNDTIDATALNIPMYIFGGDGDDTLIGGSAADTLTGGAGRNRLYGRGGEDRLNGSSGRDFLYGEGGNDRLYGNGGSDNLDGGANVDRLFGGDGDDLLDGGNQNDALYAGSGNDTLYSGKGTNILFGQDGDDTFYARNLISDILDGGAGTDGAQRDDNDAINLIESRIA